jgi:hypothetical protein
LEWAARSALLRTPSSSCRTPVSATHTLGERTWRLAMFSCHGASVRTTRDASSRSSYRRTADALTPKARASSAPFQEGA